MARIVLIAVGIIVLLVVSRRVRRVVFHIHVRRFILIFTIVALLVVLGVGGYFAWKYWWPLYMAKPTSEWHDTTLELDANPETPGTGGPAQPVIIQTR